MQEKIEKLLDAAAELTEKSGVKPRKFSRTDDSQIILNPNEPFEKDWYENDSAYDI